MLQTEHWRESYNSSSKNFLGFFGLADFLGISIIYEGLQNSSIAKEQSILSTGIHIRLITMPNALKRDMRTSHNKSENTRLSESYK